MTIDEALLKATKKLKASHITSANLDAEVLLSHTLKKPKTWLYTHPESKLTPKQNTKYHNLINRRVKQEPTSYLTEHKEFYGLDFYVNQHTLIPRPLTEEIIDTIKKIKEPSEEFIVLDIGTGSGCIGITIAKLFPKAKVMASDISTEALKVARKNARNNQVRIKFFKSDLLRNPALKKIIPEIDIITANLPYIPPKKYKKLKNNVKKYEPKFALLASEDGWEYYNQLNRQLKNLSTKKTLKIVLESPGEKIIVK